jgi:hypothetical protein
MTRTEMMNGLMALYKDALKNIAARAGYRADVHKMNKRGLASSICDGYFMEKWLDPARKAWIIECINECEKSRR